MSTGDIFANFYSKKHIDTQALASHLTEYLRKLVQDSQSTIYASSGFFSPATLSANAINSFDVTALRGQDNISNILELAASNNVPFENALNVDYYVGVGYGQVPNECEINPRTGYPEYKNIRDEVGDVADPDSVVDDGDGTITIVVDSVTEAGYSCAGRTVRIWLKNPATAVTWFEDCIVLWDGSNNYIETVGDLGQTTISETAAAYSVWRSGVTVLAGDDISTLPEYAYIGFVTGKGAGNIPDTFSHVGQKLLASDPNVALNLATAYKDIYIDPAFPNDGQPKFSDPIEFWWNQEHSAVDYSHTDVTFLTLTTILQAGLQATFQAFDIGDESAIKIAFKDSNGDNASWIYGSGKFNLKTLQTRDQTILGESTDDTLSILAKIIADVALNDGTVNSSAIKMYASGSLTRPFVFQNMAGQLIIGRNDVVASDATIKFWNFASTAYKINVEVQGTLTGYGDLKLDAVAGLTSPILKFLTNNGTEEWQEYATDAAIRIKKAAAGDGKLIISCQAGTATVQSNRGDFGVVEHSGGTLTFDDINVTNPILMSSVTDVALNTTAQNLIGAINEIFALAQTLPVHDHDDRYYTKTQLGSLINTLGSALIGHGDADVPWGWEGNTVKQHMDYLMRTGALLGKVPVDIYYSAGIQHVVVPAQVINCKGQIRFKDIATNVGWAHLDAGVIQAIKKAYYVYLKPNTLPDTGYTPVISDVEPSYGFHPTAGKDTWVYVGSFVTQAAVNQVMPFKKVGNIVMVESGDKLIAYFTSAAQTNTVLNLSDTYTAVVPKTAQMAIVNVDMDSRSNDNNFLTILAYLAGTSPAATNWTMRARNNSYVPGQTQRTGESSFGMVPLTATRTMYLTVDATGGVNDFGISIQRTGWVEDPLFGKQA